jgi:hypothetical protein
VGESEEAEDKGINQYEQDMTHVCGLIADWVDSVAIDILEDEFSVEILPSNEMQDAIGEPDDEMWEAFSEASFEDLDDSDLPVFLPQADQFTYIATPIMAVVPASLAAEQVTEQAEPPLQESSLPDVPASAAAPAPASLTSASIMTLNEDALGQPCSPVAMLPQASPSSRSSTPSSRSVRNRRRIIGGVVRGASAWEGATSCQRQVGIEATEEVQRRPKTSASAMALDLGADVAESRPGRVATPPSPASLGRGQFVYRFGQGMPTPTTDPSLERNLAKSKSLGALQVTSAKHGLGLSPSMVFSKHGGLLPTLSEAQTSKAEMIAWSVNMGKKKRNSMRTAF